MPAYHVAATAARGGVRSAPKVPELVQLRPGWGGVSQLPVADAGEVDVLLRVLGPLQVEAAGHLVPVGGRRPRALLAILSAAGGGGVSGDRLACEMYDGQEPADPIATIRVHVANIRRAFVAAGQPAEVITTLPGGYALRLSPDQTDVGRFGQACRSANDERDHEAAVALLDSALALRRGEPYQGFDDMPSVRSEAVRLAAMVRSAQVDRVERLLRLGRNRTAIGDLEPLVAGSPADEELRSLLMVALYRSGQQTAALQCADTLRRHLRREHGVEPGRRVLDLEQAILQQDPVLEWCPETKPSSTPVANDTGGRRRRSHHPPHIGPVPGEGRGAGAAADAEPPVAPRGWSLRPEVAASCASLREEVRPWIAAVAVAGRAVSIDELTAVLGATRLVPTPPGVGAFGADGEDLTTSAHARMALQEAVAAGLLVGDNGRPQRWHFVDETERLDVYTSIDAFTRALLHRRWAELLAAARAAGDPVDVTVLADHAARAGAAGLAPSGHVAWLVAAAREAAVGHDAEGALHWLTSALQAAAGGGFQDEVRLGIRLELGSARWRAGRGDEAWQTFSDLVDVARHRGDGDLLCRAAVGLSSGAFVGSLPFADGRVQELADLLDEALATDGTVAPIRARLLGHRAQVHAAQGNRGAADSVSREALAIAERTCDTRCLVDVLVCRSTVLHHPEDQLAREAVVDRLATIAASLDDDELGATVHRHLAECLIQRDEVDAARTHVDRAAVLAAGLPLMSHRIALLRSALTLVDGNWEAALEASGSALHKGEQLGDGGLSWTAHMLQLAVVHYNRNDLPEFSAIRNVLRSRSESAANPTWEPLQAMISCWLGDAGEARRRLRSLTADGCSRVPQNQVWFCNVAALVDVADALELPVHGLR